MLAKELVENSLLRFITSEAPNIDTDGVPLSQLVSCCFSKLKYSLFCSLMVEGSSSINTLMLWCPCTARCTYLHLASGADEVGG
jgi:hypothetical protein